MVNLNAFIAAVQNLTGDATASDLAQHCRKWLEENADKVSASEADRLLAAFDVHSHTLGAICALYVKMTKLKSDIEICEFLANLYEQLPQFDTKQINWAPDIYNRFFEHIADQLVNKKAPIWGILLLERAILTCSYGHPDWVTNIHAPFFCLCLKARHFDRALPFLRVDVEELFKRVDGTIGGGATNAESGPITMTDGDKVSSSENSQPAQSSSTTGGIASSAVSFIQKAVSSVSGFGIKFDEQKQAAPPFLKRRSVLLYFYYGAMIYAALEKWEEAALFLEHVICLPMMKKNSAIILEALKKYNIIWLILGRRKPMDSLPRYRSANIQRNFVSLASVYVKLWPIVQRSGENKTNLARTLSNYLSEKNNIFAKDGNAGLMKVLIKVALENSVKRLGNIFVSLNLNDVSRMAHLPDISLLDIDEGDTAERLIFRLRNNRQFAARIDGRTQTVVFEDEEKEAKGTKRETEGGGAQREVETAMNELIKLGHVVMAFERAVRKDPHYIEKSAMQKEKARTMGPGGNGGGTGHSSSMFPEDEGLFFTGSP